MELIVSDLHNNSPVFPVHPALLLSTDNRTLFIFECKSKCLSSWHFYEKGKHNTSLQSTFSSEIGGTDHLNVRVTHTMCGLGLMAPLYVTMYGLNEREFPKHLSPSGVLGFRNTWLDICQ